VLRSLFGRHRDRTAFVLVVGVSITLLNLDPESKANVARGLGTSLYAPLQSLAQNVEELFQLRQENRQLRRVVATLNLERQRLLQFREEVDELRRVAGFASERFPALVPCEIVGRSTDSFQNGLLLDCGAADSLVQDLPVTAYAGLVGRLRRVSGDRALVETLASPDLAVSAVDQRSGVVGILRWSHGNRFLLDRVDAVEDVLVGDPLVTSGLGGLYPRGIPIGVVTHVEISLDGLFKEVEVRPHVDFAGLRDVFIIHDLVEWKDSVVYSEEELQLLQELTQRSGSRDGGGE
jgi:rod shape-determining protein MreC